MDQEQNTLLKAILAELQKLNSPPMGFGPAPSTRWVYANRTNGGAWYSVVDGAIVPIPQEAITGRLKALKFERVTRRGEESTKLQVTLMADRQYTIESRYDSQFSKGLMMAVSRLTPEQVRQPITIQPQPKKDDDTLMFCRVFAGTEQVEAPYDKETDWRSVALSAISVLKLIERD